MTQVDTKLRDRQNFSGAHGIDGALHNRSGLFRAEAFHGLKHEYHALVLGKFVQRPKDVPFEFRARESMVGTGHGACGKLFQRRVRGSRMPQWMNLQASAAVFDAHLASDGEDVRDEGPCSAIAPAQLPDSQKSLLPEILGSCESAPSGRRS